MAISSPQSFDVSSEDRALQGCNSERRGDLAHGGRARCKAGLPACRACRRKSKAINPRGFGGQSPLIPVIKRCRKPSNWCPFLFGGYLNIEVSSLQVCRSSTHRQFNLLSAADLGQRASCSYAHLSGSEAERDQSTSEFV